MRATATLASHAHLLAVLTRQELAARYRGTLLGRAWPLLLPLVMLGVYGFVFGAVFRARWPGLAEDDHLGFALNLLAGLLVHGLLAESLGQAPGLMIRHSNFVRKLVFPLPVLVGVPLGTAAFHALLGLALLFAVNGLLGSGWHASALAVPLVLLPYLAMLYGLCLLFAALGVYVRDLAQVTQVLVMLALFTGAVFFPREMVPEALSGVVALNPVSWPVAAVRDGLLRGLWPEPAALGAYSGVSMLALGLGLAAFGKLRRGFADVL